MAGFTGAAMAAPPSNPLPVWETPFEGDCLEVFDFEAYFETGNQEVAEPSISGAIIAPTALSGTMSQVPLSTSLGPDMDPFYSSFEEAAAFTGTMSQVPPFTSLGPDMDPFFSGFEEAATFPGTMPQVPLSTSLGPSMDPSFGNFEDADFLPWGALSFGTMSQVPIATSLGPSVDPLSGAWASVYPSPSVSPPVPAPAHSGGNLSTSAPPPTFLDAAVTNDGFLNFPAVPPQTAATTLLAGVATPPPSRQTSSPLGLALPAASTEAVSSSSAFAAPAAPIAAATSAPPQKRGPGRPRGSGKNQRAQAAAENAAAVAGVSVGTLTGRVEKKARKPRRSAKDPISLDGITIDNPVSMAKAGHGAYEAVVQYGRNTFKPAAVARTEAQAAGEDVSRLPFIRF